MMNRAGIAAVVAALVLGSGTAANAQVTGTAVYPAFELGIGYQLVHVGGDASNTYPLGFVVDGVRNWGQLGLAGELGWARDATDVPGVAVSSNYVSFGVGPRFHLNRDEQTVRPYVQFLAGISHARFSTDFETENIQFQDIEASDTAFMVQPGVGVTWDNGGNWGFTGSVDYRRAFFDAGPGLGFDDTNEFRLFLGVRTFWR